MMILQKKVAALFSAALLLMFVASCSQPTGPVAPGSKSFGVTDPPEHSSSNFNLGVPDLDGAQTGVGEVTLTWDNGGDVGSELEGGEFFPVTGTWATSSTVVKPGSGHTEIYRWDDLLGDWVKIAEETDGNYTESGLADGTYYYYVKEKSMLNATGRETETFHSNPSNVLEVEVISCINEWTLNTVSVNGTSGTSLTGFLAQAKVGNNVSNSKFNLHFKLTSSCGEAVVGRTVRVRVVNGGAAWVNHTDGDLDGTYPVNGITYGGVVTGGPWNMEIEVLGTDNLTWEPIDYTQQPWQFKSNP